MGHGTFTREDEEVRFNFADEAVGVGEEAKQRKGRRWMPRRCVPRKGVVGHERSWGAANER